MQIHTMDNNTVTIGVDIGGTKISAAIFQFDGKILHKEIRPVAGKKGTQVAELVGNLESSR